MKKRTRAVLLVAGVAATFAAGAWFGQQRAIQTINAAETPERLTLAHAAQAADAAGTASDSALHEHSHHTAPAASSAHDHSAHAQAGSRTGHDHSGHAQPTPAGADHAQHAHGESEPAAQASAPSISVAPEQQALIGVRIAAVESAGGSHALRLFGRVAPDETRVYKLKAGADGAILDAAPVTTGSRVGKNQLLGTFAAPSAATIIQLYMTANVSAQRAKNPTGDTSMGSGAGALAAVNIRQRVDQLHSIGMSPVQMEEIAHTGEFPKSIKILSPVDGFILARNVSPGQTFEKGTEFFRVADLRRVWIVADVFEKDAQYLKPGARVQVSLPQQAERMSAKVSAVLPQFDPASRTLKVRFESDNPGFRLRPDMLVDVTVDVNVPAALAVPVDAVVDSGLRKTVFVEHTAGQFQPREVQTGRRFGERVEIVKGLAAGERIAISGTFLLDSESRMKLAMERMQAQGGGSSGHAGHHQH
jgi:membrane fusion protein, copper/silver efflux system